ncbi:helix-turn-helix domain-containing protein [Marinilabilia sp.]|uniref:helix-turn-helix domain-containing protein n=1 Tax=Marinilabilia sp. TaxID=2021252 RepID=UPI0025BF7991|nr:AraC family transcriptional regulator [Marinilabilia sp.]
MEEEYAGNITVDELANKLYASRRTFERRFKNSSGNAISKYLQRVRVEVAKRHFEEGGSPVKEAMNHVGYSDAKSFSSVLKKYVGLSPVE